MTAALACQLIALPALLLPGAAHAAKPSVKNNKEEAAAISQIAEEKNNSGDFAMCGELFQKAYRLDPSYLGYLFSAARCEQKAGQLDAAERDFRLFIARTPEGDKLAEKARKYLDEILEERKKPAPVEAKPVEPKAAETKPVEVKPAEAKPAEGAGTTPEVTLPKTGEPTVPPRAWMATIGGATLAVVGAALIGLGMAQRADLQADLTAQSDGGLITSTTPAAARDRESSYRTAMYSGAACVAIGAAATSLGLWWWRETPTAEPSKTARLWLVPTLGGAQLGLAF
ncbi:MAG: hypothetical protein HY902_09015 [Deltaproteobacteria bacterium]|nr:hypothetical protein [Deltaproteobacteria bacterium]